MQGPFPLDRILYDGRRWGLPHSASRCPRCTPERTNLPCPLIASLGLVLRDGSSETSLLKLLVTILAIFGFLGVLGWNLYALGRFEPVVWSLAQQGPAFGLGALLLGGSLLGWLARQGKRQRQRLLQRNQEAAATGAPLELEARPGSGWFGRHGVFLGLILGAGALLLGGLTSLCWSFTLNAWLDRSEPELRLIRIEHLVMVTHNFLLREYKIEYQFLAGGEGKHSLLSTPDHLDQLKAPVAIAEVHSGWLGWPWVKNIRPVKIEDLNAAVEKARAGKEGRSPAYLRG
jgi:hypothetical protein